MENNELHVNELKTVFLSRWKFIILSSIAAALVSAMIVCYIPHEYEAFSMIRIGTNAGQPYETTLMMSEIMRTQPMLEKLAQQVYQKTDLQTVLSLKRKIVFQDKDLLVKIRSTALTPDEASQITSQLTALVLLRHQEKYNAALRQRNDITLYVNGNLKSNTIVDGLGRLVIEPTRVEVEPVTSLTPVKSRRKEIVISTFMIVFMIAFLVAYTQGCKK